ncbi:MAG: iron-containing alcohol dehydrogenase [Caldicoprobacterales bacterium]|jgi:alcohol dehydrogenase|nr:iron-containing alcohol dehydrogenase [Clostridiales bacterium]
MIKDFNHYVPVRVVFGAGKLNEAGKYAAKYGSKALIVTTGSFFKEIGLVDRLINILKESGVDSEYYHDVSPNPLSTEIDAGAELGRKTGCEVVIGLGGGSAIDAAKGMAIAMGHNEPIWDFCPAGPVVKQPTDKTYPIIAITTTSGTGSHISPFSVITNPETDQKPGMGSDFIYPRVGIVDPELMLSMPKEITAATGFDVLAHSIEAYTSKIASPMSDIYAEEAIRLVGRYLRKAVTEGNDLEARSAMAYADTLAGFAMSLAINTICHGLSHAVGGISGTVHGETLAAMTPHTMRFSMNQDPEKYKKIGLLLRDETCEQVISEFTPEDAIQEVEKLIKDIGLDIPLSKQGVEEADLERIADAAFEYMSGAFDLDLRTPTREDIINILRASF